MTLRPLLASLAFSSVALAVPAAHAAEPCYTVGPGVMRCLPVSDRTRDDVIAQMSHAAPSTDPCYSVGPGVMRCRAVSNRSRADVTAELRAAQVAGNVPAVGEAPEAFAKAPAPRAVATTLAQAR